MSLTNRDVIHVDPAYAALFREIGIDADAVFDDPRIIVWRSLPDRQNAKLDYVDPVGLATRLHIKRYPPQASETAKRELAGFKLLSENKVPCAPIIAHGSRADGSSFIILPDLAGYTPADKLIESGFEFEKLLESTADLAALLHNKHLHHRDLYLCHFMIRADPMDAKLIDMARVAQLTNPLTRRRWIIKDLAQFWYSTMAHPISDEQRNRWLQRYCEARQVDPRQIAAAIQRKATAIGRHDKNLRKQQPGRNVSIGD